VFNGFCYVSAAKIRNKNKELGVQIVRICTPNEGKRGIYLNI
jgi:hypothetical protein